MAVREDVPQKTRRPEVSIEEGFLEAVSTFEYLLIRFQPSVRLLAMLGLIGTLAISARI